MSKEDNMYDLKTIFKTLAWPLALVGIVVAVLAFYGFTAEQLIAVALSLVGLQLMQSLAIDVLKYAGLVTDGTSGKWSAAFNLSTLAGVFVWLNFFPQFDLYAFDARLLELAKLLIYIFTFVTQMVGTKKIHAIVADQLGFRVQADPGLLSSYTSVTNNYGNVKKNPRGKKARA
jgi:hypothetical protein